MALALWKCIPFMGLGSSLSKIHFEKKKNVTLYLLIKQSKNGKIVELGLVLFLEQWENDKFYAILPALLKLVLTSRQFTR